MHVYWQIAYKCAVEASAKFTRRFSFFMLERGKTQKIAFLSSSQISYFIPFPILSFFLSFLLFYCWCVGEVFDQYSHSFFSYFLRREKIVFSFILVLEKSLCLHYQYRMRGLTDFVKPLRLGKKLLEIFDWLTPFSRSLRSQSLVRLFRCVDQSFSVRFLPISILR